MRLFDEADPSDAETGNASTPPGLDRHPAWAAAQARLRRFTLMSDSVPVQMAYYRRSGLVCGYANKSYAVTFGLDARSIAGRRLAEGVGTGTMRLVQPHIDRLFASRSTVRYSRSMTITAGMVRWFDISLVPHGVALYPQDASSAAG